MNYGYGMLGFGLIGFILLIVLVGLVVFAIVKATENSSRTMYSRDAHDDTGKAMEILNQKLANGEITEEEYKRKKDLIRNA